MQHTAIVKDELIGRPVTITTCTDPTWANITGVIVDETKNTFLIETKHGCKRVAKHAATFTFDINGTPTSVEGSQVAFRPEDRIKKAR